MTWTWWMTLLVIVLVLVLIGCIPVGIEGVQDEAGLRLDAKVWMLRIGILPKKPKKPKKKKKKKKEKTETPEAPKPGTAAEPAKKKPKLSLKGNGELVRLGIDSLFELLGILGEFLGGMRRKLRLEELTIHVTFDGADPAKAAIRYGRAWAVVGALIPALEQLFVIKKRDIQPVFQYNNQKMQVKAHLVLTITIGRIFSLGLRAGIRFLKFLIKNKKAVQTNESSSC